MERIAAQRARRNEVSRANQNQRQHPSPQPHRSIGQSNRLPRSSPIRESDPAQPRLSRPSVPGSRRSNAHHQSSPGPAPPDWNPSRPFNYSGAGSRRSDEENYPPESHNDIESEELDEDPRVSRRRYGVRPTTLVAQVNRDGEDDEDDWPAAPVLSRPIPDLPDDDDEALGRRPETSNSSVINQQPEPALGPRRITLTMKAMNAPQKRVCCHMGTQPTLMIFGPDFRVRPQ